MKAEEIVQSTLKLLRGDDAVCLFCQAPREALVRLPVNDGELGLGVRSKFRCDRCSSVLQIWEG
jgi:hypothetical protein